jgi:uncharacterized protein (DUF3084 family)
MICSHSPGKKSLVCVILLLAALPVLLAQQAGTAPPAILQPAGRVTIDGLTWTAFSGPNGLRILTLPPLADEARLRLERVVRIVADWTVIKTSEMRAEFGKDGDEYVLTAASIIHEGQELRSAVPAGLRLRFDGSLNYDFRVLSGAFFIRVRGALIDEASLVAEIARAVADPGTYIAERDPAWLAAQLSQLKAELADKQAALLQITGGLSDKAALHAGDLERLASRATVLEELSALLDADVVLLESRVGGLDARADAFDVQVTRLDAGQAGLQERAGRLESRADGLEPRADSLEVRAGALEARSSQLESRAGQLESRASQLESRAGQLESRSNHLEARATLVEGRADGLESRAAVLEGRTLAVEGRADRLETRADVLENRTSAVEDRASELEDRSTILEDRSTILENRAARLEARASKLESRTDLLESRTGRLESRANLVESRASQLEARSAKLEWRADELESRADDLEMRAGELETRAGLLEGRSTALEDRATVIEARLDGLDAAVEALQTELAETTSKASADRARLEQDIGSRMDGLVEGLRQALAASMNSDLFGNARPLDPQQLRQVLEYKQANRQADVATALAAFKVAGIKVSKRHVEIIYRVWFGE